MIGFITDQTKWYTDKAKALDKVTEELREENFNRWQNRLNELYNRFFKPNPIVLGKKLSMEHITDASEYIMRAHQENLGVVTLIVTPDMGKTMFGEYTSRMKEKIYSPIVFPIESSRHIIKPLTDSEDILFQRRKALVDYILGVKPTKPE